MVRHMHPLHNVPDQTSRDSDPASAGLGSDADFSVTTGEAAEMEQIYVQYLDPIYRFLYSRVGNREDAEDLTSETFLKASRQLDVGRSQASIASWLFTVARTVLADHWRKYYRYGALLPFHDVREDPVREAVPDATHQGETERWVTANLATLPWRHRRVLELRFLHGFSVVETAQELGVTPGNAKVLQHRALARLAQCETRCPTVEGRD